MHNFTHLPLEQRNSPVKGAAQADICIETILEGGEIDLMRQASEAANLDPNPTLVFSGFINRLAEFGFSCHIALCQYMKRDQQGDSNGPH